MRLVHRRPLGIDEALAARRPRYRPIADFGPM